MLALVLVRVPVLCCGQILVEKGRPVLGGGWVRGGVTGAVTLVWEEGWDPAWSEGLAWAGVTGRKRGLFSSDGAALQVWGWKDESFLLIAFLFFSEKGVVGGEKAGVV